MIENVMNRKSVGFNLAIYALVHLSSFLLPWAGLFYAINEGFKQNKWQGISFLALGLIRGFINGSAKGSDMMLQGGDMTAGQYQAWQVVDFWGKLVISIFCIWIISMIR
jgi:hypothetical protein